MNSLCVTVAIPTYNGSATIAATIESVLRQSNPDFILNIHDDGSTDDTAAIIAQYSGDARLNYFRNPINLGPEGNWNQCLSKAEGRYFKLLPHDDLLHPRCLEQQVAVLESDRYERMSLVFCARTVIGPTGRVLTQRGYPGRGDRVISARRVIGACVRRGTNLLGEPGAVLMRRALTEQVGRFDATNPYVIDLDYWFRLLAHGDAYYCAEPLASFRVSGSQWSVALGQQQSDDFLRCVERHHAGWSQPLGLIDRVLGRITPRLNNAARRVFYNVYLR